MPKNQTLAKKWWQTAIFYHIYPRSFYDSHSDGVGDLAGIIQKLDYLAGGPDSLGVKAIWISPFYVSPMIDGGYDVADHTAIDPLFGSMDDFDELVSEAHKRNLRVMIDLVPNHTSSEHPWFLASKSSKTDPKRDWYVWRDGKDDKTPPNNWLSVFGGPAWEFDNSTNQYYLHSFSKNQPDLNWDNPAVRGAMCEIADFWFKKGVDGLRVDAVNWLSKSPTDIDDPPNPEFKTGDNPYYQFHHSHSSWGPRLFEYLNDLVAICAKYGDKFMITEAYPDPDVANNIRRETAYYLQFYKKLDYRYCAPFNFEFISSPWDAQLYEQLIDQFQSALQPGQPPIHTMGNHDKPRLATRIGPEAARTAAVLLLTLPGIPFIYYGDELGMTNVNIPDNELKDSSAQGDRDPERTPMQWSGAGQAGFSPVKPWLPVSENFKLRNVAAEAKDPRSFLSLYKTLLRLRKQTAALSNGTYRSVDLRAGILAYERRLGLQKYMVVLNFTDQARTINSREISGRIILSSLMDRPPADVDQIIDLRPHESLIITAASRS